MRARAAYIHSFGTTGILVAAALMMLAVVSTIVAYDGWPGDRASGGAQPVPLEPQARAATATKAAPAAARRPVRPPAHRSAANRLSTAGLVKVVPLAPAPAAVKPPPAVPGRPALPAAPQPVPAPSTPPASTRSPHRQPPQPPDPGAVSVITGDPAVGQVETLIGDTLPQNPGLPLVDGAGQQPVNDAQLSVGALADSLH